MQCTLHIAEQYLIYTFFQGGFYWVLGSIHPKYRSSLKILNLAILCPVKWIKKYGMQQILKPLMADVVLLKSVSVKINQIISISYHLLNHIHPLFSLLYLLFCVLSILFVELRTTSCFFVFHPPNVSLISPGVLEQISPPHDPLPEVPKQLPPIIAAVWSHHGAKVKVGHCFQWIEGTLSLVLADNHGSNGIGGFMESFSANRPYRFCMGMPDEFQAKVNLLTFSSHKILIWLWVLILTGVPGSSVTVKSGFEI